MIYYKNVVMQNECGGTVRCEIAVFNPVNRKIFVFLSGRFKYVSNNIVTDFGRSITKKKFNKKLLKLIKSWTN